ncbi:hypothetical protein PHLGIDRAFT_114316 [Phlebiopsis gigantea 11061_1 CR5-6]|uniref:Pyrroloquinoline quinone-dependent pyranose dehydrogenase beta-propeller domain-containing protein n=1 Tax=Phlebiopsis gigantea (strain 11061_1 CR5-6) TaxID=745531 RepID=A0A0C3S6A9_PHLG1|nr:hypothetical protein PHLGIDRAFT_114316 [Phlebiopsis gigantea 11061_1 CR5-6]
MTLRVSGVLAVLVYCLAYTARTSAQCTPHNTLTFRSPVTTSAGLTATPIFANLTTPRGIAFDGYQNLLAVERGLGVTAFTENEPGCDGWFRSVVVQSANFTQGIQVDSAGGWLYVSTSGEVLRFAYDATSRQVCGTAQVIVNGIPPDGELTTRPILLFPSTSPTTLFVSSSLSANIDLTARDPASGRSQIRSFALPQPSSSSPQAEAAQDFFSGELLAFGIRNPAGFAFLPPTSAQLWVVDNGASIDNVTGLTSRVGGPD